MTNRVWGELELNDRGNVSTIGLKKHKVFLGRSSKADLKVSHPQLSGLHCSVEWCQDSNRVSCVDKSSNGTHLIQNGQLMKMTKDSSYDLNDGDQIVLVKGAANESHLIFLKFKKICSPSSNHGIENMAPVVTSSTGSQDQQKDEDSSKPTSVKSEKAESSVVGENSDTIAKCADSTYTANSSVLGTTTTTLLMNDTLTAAPSNENETNLNESQDIYSYFGVC